MKLKSHTQNHESLHLPAEIHQDTDKLVSKPTSILIYPNHKLELAEDGTSVNKNLDQILVEKGM